MQIFPFSFEGINSNLSYLEAQDVS